MSFYVLLVQSLKVLIQFVSVHDFLLRNVLVIFKTV